MSSYTNPADFFLLLLIHPNVGNVCGSKSQFRFGLTPKQALTSLCIQINYIVSKLFSLYRKLSVIAILITL